MVNIFLWQFRKSFYCTLVSENVEAGLAFTPTLHQVLAAKLTKADAGRAADITVKR